MAARSVTKKREGSPAADAPTGAKPTAPVGERADVGAALRNAFRATVDEGVPSELLDLLRRLD